MTFSTDCRELNFKRNKILHCIICLLLAFAFLFSTCCCSSKAIDVSSPGLMLNGSSTFYEAQSVTMYSENGQESVLLGSCATTDTAYLAIAVLPQETEIDNASTESIGTYIQKYNRVTKELSEINISIVIDESYKLYFIAADSEGVLYVFAWQSSLSGQGSLYMFPIYADDTIGTLTALSHQASLQDSPPIVSSAIDSSGNIYLGSQKQVTIMNKSGKKICTIKNEKLSGDLYSLNGMVYGLEVIQKMAGNIYLIAQINPGSRSVGSGVDISSKIRENDLLYSGNSYLCINTQDGVIAIDPITGASQQALLWDNSGVAVYDSQSYHLSILPDGKLLLLPGEVDMMHEMQPDSYQVTYLEKNPNSAIASRTQIVIGGVGISYDKDLKKCISDFNQRSTGYHVVIRDYFEEYYANMGPGFDAQSAYVEVKDQINLDILSDNGPDILIGVPEDLLDVYQLKDLLFDLIPLLDKDEDFDINILVPHIIEELKKDGKMYRICSGFAITGLAGSASLLGDRNGWTYDEFNAFAEALPSEIQVFPNCLTQPYLLEKSFAAGTNKTLGNEEIGQLLDFAKIYGSEDTNHTNTGSSTDELLNSSGPAMTEAEIYSAFQYRALIQKFGKDIQITGYPSAEGSSPCFVPVNSAAIITTTEDPEVCWEILSALFGNEYQTSKKNSQISIVSSVFERQIVNAMDPDYYPESGNWDGATSLPLSEEQVLEFRYLVESVTLARSNKDEITTIMVEEGMYYFNDQKSREEVAALIENRIATLTEEKNS